MFASREIVQNSPSVSPLIILLVLGVAIFWRVVVKLVAVTLVVLLLYGIAQFVQLVHQAGETGKSLESVRYGHVVNEGMRGGRIGPSDDCGKIVKGDHDSVVAENAVAD